MAEWNVILGDRVLERFWIEEGDKIHIGRGRTSNVSLDNTSVSRRHAILEMQNGQYLLTDLKSINGTRVNGRKITGTLPVKASDRIEIGKFRFVVGEAPEDSFPPYAMVNTPEFELTSLPNMPTDSDGTVFVAPKRLTLIEGEAKPKQLSLKGKSSFTVGKDASCDMIIQGHRVGNIQCYLLLRGDKHFLVHKTGWKRTTLNGKKMGEEEMLRGGDIIGIGGSKLKFE